MAVPNRLKEDLADVSCLLFVVEGFGDDAIKEFSALHLFGDEVVVGGFFVDIVETDDMGVLKLVEDVDFVFEGDFVFFGEFGFGDDFDGVVVVGGAVGGFDDYGEGSFTELKVVLCVYCWGLEKDGGEKEEVVSKFCNGAMK